MRHLLGILLAFTAPLAAQEEGFTPLFNGKDLTGWVNVNCAPETWTVQDSMVHCDGVPTGALRTERMYENFILELEWRHLKPGGNAGVFILPARSLRPASRSCARWKCRCWITATAKVRRTPRTAMSFPSTAPA